MAHSSQPRIGLALGSGSARGLSHIGVINALVDAGITPAVVCGSSMGAIVAAAYACGRLETLEAWARKLDARAVASYFEINWRGRGGPVKQEQMLGFLRRHLVDQPIEALPLPFAAAATDLHNGQVVWLREGSLIDAVCASAALPGILPPIQIGERWLLDGGLVDPVPVALCRAMGADIVIAVNLNAVLVGDAGADSAEGSRFVDALSLTGHLPETIRDGMDTLVAGLTPRAPGYLDVLINSIKIMQFQIANMRLAETPPDVLLTPRLGHIGLLSFAHAAEIIAEGRATVTRAAGALPIP